MPSCFFPFSADSSSEIQIFQLFNLFHQSPFLIKGEISYFLGTLTLNDKIYSDDLEIEILQILIKLIDFNEFENDSPIILSAIRLISKTKNHSLLKKFNSENLHHFYD
jgi:hypothetical protein